MRITLLSQFMVFLPYERGRKMARNAEAAKRKLKDEEKFLKT